MSNTPMISIIMPVYKVEDYVGRAIESLLNQTFTDYELLIVDDGTPDRSGDICEDYAKRDGRIKVFHQENQGAPAARNFAMDKATGKYYYFADSDDWAEPTMLADMVELAEQHSAQLVVAGYYTDIYYSENEYYTEHHTKPDGVYEGAEDFRTAAYAFFDDNLLYTPWNKLWLREHIEKNHVRYPNTFWDDFPFTVAGIRNIERVVVTSKMYYHFIKKRAESETASYRKGLYEKREQEDEMLRELYAEWKIDDAPSREMLARRYIERFIGCLENLTDPKCDLNEQEKRAKAQEMLANPRVKEALALAKPRSGYMKIMLIPVRMGSVRLSLLEAKVITKVKTGNVKLFATLKANR